MKPYPEYKDSAIASLGNIPAHWTEERAKYYFLEMDCRSIKYEDIYLKNYETGAEARAGIGRWMQFYNTLRPHSSLGGISPDSFYFSILEKIIGVVTVLASATS